MKQWLVENECKNGECRAFEVRNVNTGDVIFYRGKGPKHPLIPVVEKSAYDAINDRLRVVENELNNLRMLAMKSSQQNTVACESSPSPKTTLMDLVVFWSDCVKRQKSQLKMLEETFQTLKAGTHAWRMQSHWIADAGEKLNHAQRVIQELDAQKECLEQGVSV